MYWDKCNESNRGNIKSTEISAQTICQGKLVWQGNITDLWHMEWKLEIVAVAGFCVLLERCLMQHICSLSLMMMMMMFAVLSLRLSQN